jgi:8-oxo-dGTP pyrophosphatase MutT (NUDIX family)
MATPNESSGDRAGDRKAFLEAVVSARLPIRAKNLAVPGLDRRAVQKRLERLRRLAGGPDVADEELVEYARESLSQFGSPCSQGLLKLRALAAPLARQFADSAGLQGTVIGDWVELARGPGDRGWTRTEIAVRELPKRTIFLRGKTQSWLGEKKRFLRKRWHQAKSDPALKSSLVPNRLKADLGGFDSLGSEDSPRCVIRIAPVDWLTCQALNARLDMPGLVDDPRNSLTLRDRWGNPSDVIVRRTLPGMLVAHIIIVTTDRRFLVCRREVAGMQDEPGTWSMSIEERWSLRRQDPDEHPNDVVARAIREELGLDVGDEDIRVLSWGVEATVLYPGFLAIAMVPVGSWEVPAIRGQAPDSNEVRFVSSVPASLDSLDLLDEAHFTPPGHPDLRRRWHRTSKARLFSALVHLESRVAASGRDAVLSHLGLTGQPSSRGHRPRPKRAILRNRH